ncbi:DUF6233 domain-containing protein [Streptomyces yokosukanensis]|uniref:DUF6233 domain-containing protein n=1 Tax=Streptomyces yokosukanensis TaxID=67386 RepID=UPI003419247A
MAAEERRLATLRQGAEREQPWPDWLIQYGLNRRNIDSLHRGDCWAAAQSGRCRPLTREQALDALRDVPACTHCQPDTELRFLERRQPRPPGVRRAPLGAGLREGRDWCTCRLVQWPPARPADGLRRTGPEARTQAFGAR